MRSENVLINGRNAADLPMVVIEPRQGWIGINLPELLQYRELAFFLVWRDVKVRYKQTVLGTLWAILQPITTMLVFSTFLGRLATMPSDGVPYPIFCYAALVPWTFFATGLTQSSNSLVSGANLLRKVYFPRLLMPAASVLAGTIDFALTFLVLVVMMVYYGFAPTAAALWLPGLALLAFVTSLGVGLWLSALNVEYRDVRYVVPFLVQIWLFATPVAYSSGLVPERWRAVYTLNPMVAVVDGFRWMVAPAARFPGASLALGAGAVAVLLVGGLYVFRRMERTFADVV